MVAMGFAMAGVVLLIYLVFLLGIYVLSQFGLYRMARHAGIPGAWLAFIPVGNGYITGLLAERAVFTYTGRQRRLAFWNLLLQGIITGLALLMIILSLGTSGSDGIYFIIGLAVIFSAILSIAAAIVYIYSLYYIFKDYAPDNAVLFTILGVVFSIYWIFLLVVMNVVPVSVTGFGTYPYGRPKYDKYHQWPQNPPQQPGYGPQGGYGGYQGYPNQGYSGYQGGYPGQGPQPGGSYTTRPGDYAPGPGAYPPPNFNNMGGGYDPNHPQQYSSPAAPGTSGTPSHEEGGPDLGSGNSNNNQGPEL